MSRWPLQMLAGASMLAIGALSLLRPDDFSAGQVIFMVWAGGALFGQAFTKWEAGRGKPF